MMQFWQSVEPGIELALTKYLRKLAGRLLSTGDGIGAFMVARAFKVVLLTK